MRSREHHCHKLSQFFLVLAEARLFLYGLPAHILGKLYQSSLRLPNSFRLVRRAVDILPLTGRGLLAGILCGLALRRWAFEELDLVLFVIGVAGLVLLGLAVFFVCGAALYLSRRMDKNSDGGLLRLEAGHPTSTGFRVPALSRLPLPLGHRG